MKIENINACRVSLSGYAFPEFYILVLPAVEHDGKPVNYCYLGKNGCCELFFMFGCYESVEEAAELAYANVSDYLPDFVRSILEDE